jgi:Putative transposase
MVARSGVAPMRSLAGHLVFHAAPSPSHDDLEDVVRIVHRRALRWLERRGPLERLPLEERSNEPALPSPLEPCAAIATMRTLAPDAASTNLAKEAVGVASNAPLREGGAVEHEGFNLHASVRIVAEDDRGRERLCKYGARPPFSLERLRVLPGSRIAYRIKKLGCWSGKASGD